MRGGKGTHLDLDEVVAEAIVDADLRADHLGDDQGVAEVGLDNGGLLGGVSHRLLGLAEADQEVLEALVVATDKAAASAGVEHLQELLLGDVEQLLCLNTPVEVLTERLLNLVGLHRAQGRDAHTG